MQDDLTTTVLKKYIPRNILSLLADSLLRVVFNDLSFSLNLTPHPLQSMTRYTERLYTYHTTAK